MKRIEFASGKYTALLPEGRPGDTGLKVLRYGEAWRDLTGDNFVMILVSEVDYLRMQVEKLSEKVIYLDDNTGTG